MAETPKRSIWACRMLVVVVIFASVVGAIAVVMHIASRRASPSFRAARGWDGLSFTEWPMSQWDELAIGQECMLSLGNGENWQRWDCGDGLDLEVQFRESLLVAVSVMRTVDKSAEGGERVIRLWEKISPKLAELLDQERLASDTHAPTKRRIGNSDYVYFWSDNNKAFVQWVGSSPDG